MRIRGIEVPALPQDERRCRELLEGVLQRSPGCPGIDLQEVARHGVKPGLVPHDALALQVFACHELLRSVEPGMVLGAGCFLARAYVMRGCWSEFRQVIRALDHANREELSKSRPVCLDLNDPLFATGLMLFELGRVDEALEHLEALEALSRGGLRAELLEAIASCRHSKREWETAVGWYGEASIHHESSISCCSEEDRPEEIARWQMVNAAMLDAQMQLEFHYELRWFGPGGLRAKGCSFPAPLPAAFADTGWALEAEPEAGYPPGALEGHWVLHRGGREGPSAPERLSTFRYPVFWHWSAAERALHLHVAENGAGLTVDAQGIHRARDEARVESIPEAFERTRGGRTFYQALSGAPRRVTRNL